MRILRDESVPEALGKLLIEHSWSTVQREGWTGLSNGELLATASAQSDVLLAADRNMVFQQNLTALPMSIVVMPAISNRVEALAQVMPAVLRALDHLQPRSLVKVKG